MNKIFAIAGVVIKELYRRKDFYVLFVLTALITLLLGSVNFFNDDRIAGYLRRSACCSSGFRRSSSPSPPRRARFPPNARTAPSFRSWRNRSRASR